MKITIEFDATETNPDDHRSTYEIRKEAVKCIGYMKPIHALGDILELLESPSTFTKCQKLSQIDVIEFIHKEVVDIIREFNIDLE